MPGHRIARKTSARAHTHAESRRAGPIELSDDTASPEREAGTNTRSGAASNSDVEVEPVVQRQPVTTKRKDNDLGAVGPSTSAGAGYGDIVESRDSLSEDASCELSSSSSESLELVSGASTDDGPAGPHALPDNSHNVLATPAAFRTPVRLTRTRNTVQAVTSSPPKTARLALRPASPDSPLPHPPFEFDILNHAPARHPVPPPAWREPHLRTAEENIEEAARARDRRRRVTEQRALREPAGQVWEWGWEREGPLGIGADIKGQGKATEGSTVYHAATVFPYAHLPGLSYMADVVAVAGDAKVKLYQLGGASSSTQSSPLVQIASYTNAAELDPSHRDREEYFTCAWSVNITTHPYTPVLAVAGRGRVINVFLVGRRPSGAIVLCKDRTITGHGGAIHDLAFHPSYPHLLASASADNTVRLWDTTVPFGSDAAVSERMRPTPGEGWQRAAARKKAVDRLRASDGGKASRPRVDGELLAVLAEGGHEKAVMSCDFHATFPLVVTAGNDGFVKLWQLPPAVLDATPYWPSTPLFRHPSAPPPFAHPPVLGPPIFSSYAIHPGQWPDQVRFASPTTCAILSKAPVTHPDARFSPRTSVKFWVPSILDVLPSSTAGQRTAAVERARSLARAQGPHVVPDLLPLQAPLSPNARSDSAFSVLYEAVLEGQNCVGDTLGWYRPLAHGSATVSSGPDEPFFVVAPATPLPVREGAAGDEALYFFRPFAPPPHEPSSSASAPPLAQSLTRVSSTTSTSTSSASQSSTAATRAVHVDIATQALFPLDRDRSMHDFTPRLQPSAIADVFPGGVRERGAVHWRALAVSADGRDVVAVGDEGAVAVFRGRRRGVRPPPSEADAMQE